MSPPQGKCAKAEDNLNERERVVRHYRFTFVSMANIIASSHETAHCEVLNYINTIDSINVKLACFITLVVLSVFLYTF